MVNVPNEGREEVDWGVSQLGHGQLPSRARKSLGWGVVHVTEPGPPARTRLTISRPGTRPTISRLLTLAGSLDQISVQRHRARLKQPLRRCSRATSSANVVIDVLEGVQLTDPRSSEKRLQRRFGMQPAGKAPGSCAGRGVSAESPQRGQCCATGTDAPRCRDRCFATGTEAPR
jgi:hypothetical protein